VHFWSAKYWISAPLQESEVRRGNYNWCAFSRCGQQQTVLTSGQLKLEGIPRVDNALVDRIADHSGQVAARVVCGGAVRVDEDGLVHRSCGGIRTGIQLSSSQTAHRLEASRLECFGKGWEMS